MNSSSSLQKEFLEINGAQIYYEMMGTGHPVVLIHAGIADHRMWDRQFEIFAQQYKVIRYDQRGFGKTTTPKESFSRYRDLYELLRRLDITSATLVGCSMGGATAINLALEYPKMVNSMVLVASAVEGYKMTDPGTFAAWDTVEAAVKEGNYEKSAELEADMWLVGPDRVKDQVDPSIYDLVVEMIRPTYVYEIGFEQPLDSSAITRLPELKIPTFIIVGDKDQPDVLKMSTILKNEIKGSSINIIPDTAHLPNLEKSTQFNEIVLDFIAQNFSNANGVSLNALMLGKREKPMR